MHALRLGSARAGSKFLRSASFSNSYFPSFTMASTNKVELPDSFLSGPAPNLTKRVIDFKKEGIPQYDGRWAVILDGVLSQEECDTLIKAAEMTSGGQWERVSQTVCEDNEHMLNVTGNGQCWCRTATYDRGQTEMWAHYLGRPRCGWQDLDKSSRLGPGYTPVE